MRWPWQTAPGMVRISRKQLIELQANALKTMRLENEILAFEAQTRATEARIRASDLRTEARIRASELLAQAERVSTPDVEATAAAVMLADLPLSADGSLHEAAFSAAHRGAVWVGHEALLLEVGEGQ